jgi:hypothetical protein
MLGSALLPEGSVAAMTVPQKPNSSSAMDEITTARFERKHDENFIVMSRCGGAGGTFGPPKWPRWQGASLSGSIDIAFSPKGEKHHWKCPMYLANFRLCPF